MNPFNDGKLYERIPNKKGNGARYKAVRNCRAYEGLSKGCWLVRIDEGCTSTCQSITPDNAAIELAAKIATDKVVKILGMASEAKYVSNKNSFGVSQTPLSKRELRAIAAYNEVMGEEKSLYFQFSSLQGMAEEIIAELTKGTI